MEKLEVVSLIPARGGSVRVPRKNIKMMAGKPMMNWTIEASLKSKYIDRTFVSTEDREIKEIALKAGAEVVDRPEKLASGDGIYLLANHFTYCLWKEHHVPHIVIMLLATVPLRTEKHIDEAYELYRESKADFLCSVCSSSRRFSLARYIDRESGLLKHYFDWTKFRNTDKITSLFPDIYYNNGAIYIGPALLNVNIGCVSLGCVAPYIMNIEDSVDVDWPFDFKVAEMLLKERIAKEKQNKT